MEKAGMQTVTLSGYQALGEHAIIRLGTWGSYGIEQMQIVPGKGWEGLVITATFVTPSGSTRMVVPEDGVLDVPQEATAHALSPLTPGKIVFAGTADGVQRISADLAYFVSDHAPINGTAPEPTPDEWAQLVALYQAMLDKAVPPNGTPGYVLGATENGNAWVPQTGGGGGSGGIITDDDTGTVYDAAVHIQDGYPVLILTERSAHNG